MSKTKYSVETAFGALTRTTARTYTHVVVATGRKESIIRAAHADNLKYRLREVAKYKAIVERIDANGGEGTVDGYDKAKYLGWIAEVERVIAGIPADVEESVTRHKNANANNIAIEVTWAGRPDLAEKAASKFRSQYDRVEVYPVG